MRTLRSISLEQPPSKIRIALAADQDRETIFRMRHDVYALELAQHRENAEERLTDSLDAFNIYLAAWENGKIAGFISITPPGQASYSIDKYLSREELPFPVDEGLYEIRLLTVAAAHRGRQIAALLMYAAFRWVEARGGTRVVAIGRQAILDLYLKVGLKPLGRQVQSGAVTFELMSATTAAVREHHRGSTLLLQRLAAETDWQLEVPFWPAAACEHGGAFFNAIGDEFDTLERREEIINADVLDAWYPPAPGVSAALQEHLPWLLRTSPPAGGEGMLRAIARARRVPVECLALGAGSSSLIFLAFREWLTSSSRVLILDPTYGEYAHVLEQVVCCNVDRIPLSRHAGYCLDPGQLRSRLDSAYDLIVLVNPNSPTGRHLPRAELEPLLALVPARTRVWVDEAYVEYAGSDESVERFAARSVNVIVCKSMSKVYALSGVRAPYLCAPEPLAAALRRITPPWAVSLPAQVAAVMALRDPDYYEARYRETRLLRAQLVEALLASNELEVIPSAANFVLCHLPASGPTAAAICDACRAHGLFLRDAASMSRRLGSHALRIAVKDRATNRRIVEILTRALREAKCGTGGDTPIATVDVCPTLTRPYNHRTG